MKKVISTLCYCLFIAISVKAQVKLNCDSTALAKKYFQNAMYIKQGFWGTDYERNGGTYSVGFFNSNLRSEFNERKVSPLTLRELQKSTTNKILSSALAWGSIIPLFFVNKTNSNNTNQNLVWTFFGASIASIPFSIIGNNQRSRAVWLYNKDVMSRE
jgi:hypothetical protein